MACDGYNFHFLFWAICCPFNPLTAQKIKIEKKIIINEIKNTPGDNHFTNYTFVPKIMIT